MIPCLIRRTFATGAQLALALDLAIAPTVGPRVKLPDGPVLVVEQVIVPATSGAGRWNAWAGTGTRGEIRAAITLPSYRCGLLALLRPVWYRQGEIDYHRANASGNHWGPYAAWHCAASERRPLPFALCSISA